MSIDDMSKLSLDGHKLLHHLEPLLKWQRGEVLWPLYCQISLTQVCNHRCVFCVYAEMEREKVYMDADKIIAVIREMVSHGLKALFLSGEGEPLAHPDVVRIIQEAKESGVDVALNTNGALLRPELARNILEHLSFVRMSINGQGEGNYRSIHGCARGGYARILENLREARAIKEEKGLDLTLGTQCILLAENIDRIEALTADLRDAGADYLAFKPFLKIESTEWATDLPLDSDLVCETLRRCEAMSTDDFSVHVRWDSLRKIEGRTYDRCLSVPFMVEIDCIGDVYTCGVLLGREEFAYGNVFEQTFGEMLASERYGRVAGHIRNELDVHKCMPNCRNDAVNRFLWSLRNPPDHVNFI